MNVAVIAGWWRSSWSAYKEKEKSITRIKAVRESRNIYHITRNLLELSQDSDIKLLHAEAKHYNESNKYEDDRVNEVHDSSGSGFHLITNSHALHNPNPRSAFLKWGTEREYCVIVSSCKVGGCGEENL